MTLANFFRGDTKTYALTFRDAQGAAIPLYGKSLFFTLKSDLGLPDASAELSVTVVFPDDADSTAGNGSLQLTSDDTNTLTPGKYFYDFQLVDPSTNPATVTTLASGSLKVLEDVTRNIV